KVAPKEQETKKLHKELETIEQRIGKLEEAIKTTGLLMADEATYADQSKLEEASRRYDTLKQELAERQTQWEKLADEIMTMDGYHNMKKLPIGVVLLLVCLGRMAQKQKKKRAGRERTPQQELVYDNLNYLEAIKSVQFYPVDQENALPVIELHIDEQLTLAFDDLR